MEIFSSGVGVIHSAVDFISMNKKIFRHLFLSKKQKRAINLLKMPLIGGILNWGRSSGHTSDGKSSLKKPRMAMDWSSQSGFFLRDEVIADKRSQL